MIKLGKTYYGRKVVKISFDWWMNRCEVHYDCKGYEGLCTEETFIRWMRKQDDRSK